METHLPPTTEVKDHEMDGGNPRSTEVDQEGEGEEDLNGGKTQLPGVEIGKNIFIITSVSHGNVLLIVILFHLLLLPLPLHCHPPRRMTPQATAVPLL
jgi:hypothetical protein